MLPLFFSLFVAVEWPDGRIVTQFDDRRLSEAQCEQAAEAFRRKVASPASAICIEME